MYGHGKAHSDGGPDQGPQQVDPQVAQFTSCDGRSGRSRWVHRSSFEGQGDQTAQDDRGTDSNRCVRADKVGSIGRPQDDRDKGPGQKYLEEESHPLTDSMWLRDGMCRSVVAEQTLGLPRTRG